jgi:DNA polymerase-3 subunit gamma/tau
VVDAMVSEDASKLLLIFDKISRKGFDGDIFMNGLAEHLRNLLVCQDARTLDLLEVGDRVKRRYQQQANLVATSLILSALSLANECDVNYKMARNKRLHVEMALIRMAYMQRSMLAYEAAPRHSDEKKTAIPNAPAPTNRVEEPRAAYTPQSSIITKEKAASPTPEEAPVAVEEPEEKAPVAALKSDNTPAPESSTKINKFAEKLAQKKSNGLIDSIKNEVITEDELPQQEALPFTQENIMQLWQQYWQTLESPSTQILFKTAQIEILDAEQGALKVIANGNRAKDAIFREAPLKQLLIQEFQKKSLTLEVVIDENKLEVPKPKPMLPQTDREKYVHFLKMNPALKDFQKKFKLLPPKN